MKRSGIVSYRYSTDQVEYYRIGSDNSGLSLLIKNDSVAFSQLANYHSSRRIGQAVLLTGLVTTAFGCFVVWNSDDENRQWTVSDFSIPLLVGGAVSFAGIVISLSANTHLTAAVDSYNASLEHESDSSIRINSGQDGNRVLSVGLYIRF